MKYVYLFVYSGKRGFWNKPQTTFTGATLELALDKRITTQEEYWNAVQTLQQAIENGQTYTYQEPIEEVAVTSVMFLREEKA